MKVRSLNNSKRHTGFYLLHRKGTVGIYIIKKDGKSIIPYIQFSAKDMWFKPQKKWMGKKGNILVMGWLFFYFGIIGSSEE